MHTQKNYYLQTLPIGFALFAMFFGAGNLIFPLDIGAHSGQHLFSAILGFLIFGVGAPFLGLFATSIFNGDYEDFFNQIGKVPAFILITFLMLIIGPLSAMPRTEVVAFRTIEAFLPQKIDNIIFSLIYCGLVFITSYKETRFMNILGNFLSPIKLISFTVLIIIGGIYIGKPIVSEHTAIEVFKNSVLQGYSTMDLLAAFFFCSLAYRAIHRKVKHQVSEVELRKLTLISCVIGAICLSTIYIGFMVVANVHGSELASFGTDQIIRGISEHVLGKFGSFFVGVCITIACFATAMALAEVTGNYLYYQVFKHRVRKIYCVLAVCIIMFFMTQLGFNGLMNLVVPVLVIIYPSLIVLCIANILHKLAGFKYVKASFGLALVISAIVSLI